MKWASLLLVLSILAMSAAANEVDKLIVSLNDSNNEVRFQAALALGNLSDPKGVEPLILALKDNDSKVRGTAAWALGIIDDDRAVEPLVGALKDPEPSVRQYAVWALGEMGGAKSGRSSNRIAERRKLFCKDGGS